MTVGPNPSLTELKSQSLVTNYVESGGVRISEASSRVVAASVARFDTIVAWYSEKLGGTVLDSRLAAHTSRVEHAAELEHGQATSPTPIGEMSLYRFTPDHKQITIVAVVDGGDLIAVSLHGTNAETSIQVVRRHPDRENR